MCELLVGLPDANVLGITDTADRLRVMVETRGPRPVAKDLGCGWHPVLDAVVAY